MKYAFLMEERQTEPGDQKGTGYEARMSVFPVASQLAPAYLERGFPATNLQLETFFFADVTTGCPDDVS